MLFDVTFCNSYVLWLLRCVQLRLVTVTLCDVNVVWCYILSQYQQGTFQYQKQLAFFNRGRIQRKAWCKGPYSMPELNITSPYVQSRVDSNTFTMGNPMPESTLTLCQSRLYPLVRDFGFSLMIWYTLINIYKHKFIFYLFFYVFNTASSAAPQIPLCRNPGLLRLRHWQSDALTTRLDLISLNLYPSVVYYF